MFQHVPSRSFRSFAIFGRCSQRTLQQTRRAWLEGLCVRFGGTACPTKEEERVFWSYEDLGIFFLLVALLSLTLHALVRLRVLPESELSQPDDSLQMVIVTVLITGLFAVLKLRHRKPVLRPLGWVLPSGGQLSISLLTGVLLATGALLYTQRESAMAPLAHSVEGVLAISLLGPMLEETLFRGCLLPLIARTVGNKLAIIASACIFAVFHAPTDIAHGVFFAIGGIVYGWIGVASATTTAPAFAHAFCNLILLFGPSY